MYFILVLLNSSAVRNDWYMEFAAISVFRRLDLLAVPWRQMTVINGSTLFPTQTKTPGFLQENQGFMQGEGVLVA